MHDKEVLFQTQTFLHLMHSFPQPPSPKGAAAYTLRKSSGGGKHAYRNAGDHRNNDRDQDPRDELWESRNSDHQQTNQQSGRKSRGKKGNKRDSGSKGNSRGSRNEPRSSVEQDQLDFDVVSRRKKQTGHICICKNKYTQEQLHCISSTGACYGAALGKLFCVLTNIICPASFFLWDTWTMMQTGRQ